MFLPHLILLLSVLSPRIIFLIFTLKLSILPPPHSTAQTSPLIPPSSFLKATCSQPVWLSCTLPMKGFLLGWDWVQPSRALAGAEAGASSAAPQPPPPPSTSTPLPSPTPTPLYRPLHMPVLVWPCRPEADYLFLLSLIAYSSRKEPERERERVGTVLACWGVTWQAWTQRFVFLLSSPGSALVGFYEDGCCFHQMLVGSL